jgi:hypothetical protein
MVYIVVTVRIYNFNLHYSMPQWMIAFTSHHDSDDNTWKNLCYYIAIVVYLRKTFIEFDILILKHGFEKYMGLFQRLQFKSNCTSKLQFELIKQKCLIFIS